MLHADFTGPAHWPLLEADDGVEFRVDAEILSSSCAYLADLLSSLPKSSGQLNARIVVPVPGISSSALAAALTALTKGFAVPPEPEPNTYTLLDGVANFVAEFNAADVFHNVTFDTPTLFVNYTLEALGDAARGEETKLEPWIDKLFMHVLPFGEFSSAALAAAVSDIKGTPVPPPKCINDWCLAVLRRHVPRALGFVGMYARQTELLNALFTVDMECANAPWAHARSCLDAIDGVEEDDDYDPWRGYAPLQRQLRPALHGPGLRAAKLAGVTPPLPAPLFVALAYTSISCAACRAEIRSGLVKTYVTRRPPRAWRAPLRECAAAQAAAIASIDATREDAEWFGYDGHGREIPGQAEFHDFKADEPPPAISGTEELAILKEMRAHEEHARKVAVAAGHSIE